MVDTFECSEHGPQQATSVCCHLVESLSTRKQVGFYFASEQRGDAWCAACEEVRIGEGGKSGDWNDRSEAFANVQMLCGLCYDKVRALNVT